MVLEGAEMVTGNLEDNPAAFPYPREFQWTKDGSTVVNMTDSIVYGYPSVIFNNVSRVDAGIYSLFARNFLVDGSDIIGSDTGNFTLDVLCEYNIALSCSQFTIQSSSIL